MAQNTTLNGVTYSIPEPGDTGWGAQLTAFLLAIAPAVLQKTGGLFTLTSEIDFGTAFGIKSLYFKTRANNPASAGVVRLANTEAVAFRNFANSGNNLLSTNALDELTYNGVKVAQSGLIVNADISPSAAIAYSKLNLSNSIVNADINASAAIAYSKLAALAANRALQSDGSGFVSASAVTSTELGYVSGVTSAIQTQIDSKATDTNLVHITGTETITGQKTFSLSPILSTLTANRALVSSGAQAIASIATTATELGFVNGVTSAIQTQLNTKIDTAGTGLNKSGTTLNLDTPVTRANGGTGVTTKLISYGSYTGNGTTQNIAHNLGTTPSMVIVCVLGVGTNIQAMWMSDMAAPNSHQFNGVNQTNMITAVDSTNISIGANASVNQNTVTYGFIVFKGQ